jgi:hypothetical protein
MQALVTIAGYELPEPSTYSASTSTLVDSARNAKGYVIGSVIRSDVAKVELSWRYLTAEQWARVLSLFTRSFYNQVTFFNQSTGTYETRQMYVGDRSAGMWRRHPVSGEVMGFTECKLALVEV